MHVKSLEFRLLNALVRPEKSNSGCYIPVVIVPQNDSRSADVEWMQERAVDFAYPVTAFLVPKGDRYGLRYFTIQEEIPTCGHATFACAGVIFEQYPDLPSVEFDTVAGVLRAARRQQGPSVSLPFFPIHAYPPDEKKRVVENAATFLEDLAVMSKEDIIDISTFSFAGRTNYLIELREDVDLSGLKIDGKSLTPLSTALVVFTHIISAESNRTTLCIHTRVFASGLGVDEDIISGVPHSAMTGYYLSPPVIDRLPPCLRKTHPKDIALMGVQLSPRGGLMTCHLRDHDVEIIGQNTEWAKGQLDA